MTKGSLEKRPPMRDVDADILARDGDTVLEDEVGRRESPTRKVVMCPFLLALWSGPFTRKEVLMEVETDLMKHLRTDSLNRTYEVSVHIPRKRVAIETRALFLRTTSDPWSHQCGRSLVFQGNMSSSTSHAGCQFMA
ncbi:hypothetical protein VTO42DRAFT_263 [Malbranchea cinnamomea]